jgi:hypothetical protein
MTHKTSSRPGGHREFRCWMRQHERPGAARWVRGPRAIGSLGCHLHSEAPTPKGPMANGQRGFVVAAGLGGPRPEQADPVVRRQVATSLPGLRVLLALAGWNGFLLTDIEAHTRPPEGRMWQSIVWGVSVLSEFAEGDEFSATLAAEPPRMHKSTRWHQAWSSSATRVRAHTQNSHHHGLARMPLAREQCPDRAKGVAPVACSTCERCAVRALPKPQAGW